VINKIVLPSAYLPSIYYFKLLLHSDVVIDANEHFVKQTIRNRCSIYAANGALSLTIPLQKSPNNTPTVVKLMSTDLDWKTLHWRSIVSAYNGSAYFEYFEHEFEPLFSKENNITNLVEWNTTLLKVVFKILRIQKELVFSDQYVEQSDAIIDGRNLFDSNKITQIQFRPYYQVFSDKHGFIPNLSILDLLFHQGLKSLAYL
jgi:WbqC-like protein family